MKTLHKIFNKNLFRNYFVLILLTLLSILIILYSSESESELLEHLSKFTIVLTFLSWLSFFFSNFITNIDDFLNQNYTRFQLLKFHLLTQSFKLLLCLLPILIIYSFSLFINKKFLPVNIFHFPPSYYLFGLILIMLISLKLLSPVHLPSPQEIAATRRAQAKIWFEFILILVEAFLLLSLLASQVMFIEVPVFFIAFSSILAMMIYFTYKTNDKFKLFRSNQYLRIFTLFSIIAFIPTSITTFLSYQESHNPKLSYERKLESVKFLGLCNTSFKKEEMLSFLKEAKNYDDYKIVQNLFQPKLNRDEALDVLQNKSQTHAFIKYHLNLSPNEAGQIIESVSSIIKDKDWRSDFILASDELWKPLRDLKDSKDLQKKLILSDDTFEQYIGYRLSLISDKEEFYEKHKKDYQQLFIKIDSKRSIASKESKN